MSLSSFSTLSARHVYGQVDLVFVLGCTASMSNCINETVEIIRGIVRRLASNVEYDVRIALVLHRGDNGSPSQGNNVNCVVRSYNFSRNLRGIQCLWPCMRT